MTLRPVLQLKKHPHGVPSEETPLEWLVTNGLGGYSSGTVDGPPARRFHGLLVAALPAPAGRVLLLHAIDDTVQLPGAAPIRLRPHQGDLPTAHRAEFYLQAGLPHWVFTLRDDVALEQVVMMPHSQNTVPVSR